MITWMFINLNIEYLIIIFINLIISYAFKIWNSFFEFVFLIHLLIK